VFERARSVIAHQASVERYELVRAFASQVLVSWLTARLCTSSMFVNDPQGPRVFPNGQELVALASVGPIVRSGLNAELIDGMFVSYNKREQFEQELMFLFVLEETLGANNSDTTANTNNNNNNNNNSSRGSNGNK